MKRQIMIILTALIMVISILLSNTEAQGFSALLEKLDNLETRIAQLEQKMESSKTDDNSSEFNKRLERIETSVNQKSDQDNFAEVEQAITGLSSRLELLEARLVTSDDGTLSTNPELFAELQVLTQELREVLSQTDNGLAASSEKSVSLNHAPKITGLFKTLYEYNVNESQNDENDFSIYYGRVSIKGDVTQDIGYQLQVDFARDSDDMLLDAFAFFHPSLWSKVTVGQFKSPYSTVNLRSASKQRFISKPLMASKTAPKTRDIGFSFSVDGDNYSTVFGVFNGVGQNQPDDNTTKNLAGRIDWTFSPMLQFSGNAYYGKTNEVDSLSEELKMYNGGAMYTNGNFSVESEYGFYETKSLSRTGYFVDALYEYKLTGIIKSISPGIRYDWYDPDNDIDGDIQTRYTAGLKFQFDKLPNMHFRVNYLVDDNEDSDTQDKQILSEIQLTF